MELVNVIVSLSSLLATKAWENRKGIAESLLDHSAKFMNLLKTKFPDIAETVENTRVSSSNLV